MTDSLYDINVTRNNGQSFPLSEYAGQVLLVVNTASKCGFTYQYEGLEKLYKKHANDGLTILAFPCDQFGHQEPGSNDEIQQFCQMNYGVSFPVHQKTEVNGSQAHPLFVTLKEQAPGLLGSKRIKWNFTKFLVSKSGRVIKRYAPTTKPEEIERDILQLLSE